jgi:hypothetical protein
MVVAAAALGLVGIVSAVLLPRVAWVTPRMAAQRRERAGGSPG